MLIVDDVATAAIGGVMGAGTTEVRDTTTDVMLEAAVWDPAAVSRTQRRLHLTSEAGRRYERTVDPAVSMPRWTAAATLLADIAGGTVEPRLTDWRGDPPRDDWSQPPVSMAVDLPDRMAGVDYADGTTQRRLTQIGADVVTDGDRVTATPPSWRPDLREPADLVEEVLRLEGLEIIPSVLPQAPAGSGLTPIQKRRRAIGKSLALNGYVEILPTPFLPAGVFDQLGLPADDPRRTTTQVLNPLESDRPQLATTLLPGLLEALARNVSRGAVDAALYAIAQVVEPTSETRAVERIPNSRRPTDEEIAILDASLPRQPQHVGVVMAGLREPAGPWGRGRPAEAWDAFEAVRVIGRAAGVELTLRAAQYLPWHPGRCAEVLVRDTVVGHAGQLHPAVVERGGLPKGTCAVELDLDAIPMTETLPAPAVSPFPAVFQDVSLIVGEDVAAQTVVDAVRDGAGELLEDVRLFDVYTGPQIGDGRKSVTLALRFRAADRTLTEDEASAARDAAVADRCRPRRRRAARLILRLLCGDRLEIRRRRFGAVVVHERPVGRVVALGSGHERLQPQQRQFVQDKAWLARYGGQPIDRRQRFLKVSFGAAIKQRFHEDRRGDSQGDHPTRVIHVGDRGSRQFDGVVEIAVAGLLPRHRGVDERQRVHGEALLDRSVTGS